MESVGYRKINMNIEIKTRGKRITESILDHDSLYSERYNKEMDGSLTGVEIFIFNEDGRFVGRVEILNKGQRAHIFHLMVAEEKRRMGIGGTLINATKQYITSAGYKRISGRIRNGGTRKFLKNQGFNPRYLHTSIVGYDRYETVSITTNRSVDRHGHKSFNAVEDKYEGVPIDNLI